MEHILWFQEFGEDLTSPQELKDIADIAVKYNVPTVKFTGGQRLDMLGVKKEQLAPMWQDLNDAGFVSGQAYAKGLRTVKTCVGNTWCRFGTQDSMNMGVIIEKLTWGSLDTT
jgi:nitrite reductase (NADH) large subunit